MTDAAPPVGLVWDDTAEVFRPAGKHTLAVIRKHYAPGSHYIMQEHRQRSSASHNHFYAVLAKAHDSLPERWQKLLPTREHLRHYCLIRTGFEDSQTYACDTEKEAIRLMRVLKPLDEFSLITRDGCVVTRHVAKSQSAKAMGKEDFEASKQRCIDLMAHMIGVSAQDLAKAGK